MLRRRLALSAVLLAVVLETSCPPDVAAARSDVDRAQARLRVPARTPREVLELATKQLTTGFGAWSVHDGRLPPYALDVAQRGAVLRLHVRRPAEELWIGARVQGGFSFFCRAVSERPKCSKADPSGRNGEALAYVKAAFFFFPDYLHQTFDPVLGSARVVQGRRLGTPVSCLEGQRRNRASALRHRLRVSVRHPGGPTTPRSRDGTQIGRGRERGQASCPAVEPASAPRVGARRLARTRAGRRSGSP